MAISSSQDNRAWNLHDIRGAVQCRNDSARSEGDAAYTLSSESSSSQAVSASACTGQPSMHAQGGRHFGVIRKGANMGAAPKGEQWLRTTWDSRLDTCVRAQDDKHATWGASQHLQERLANVRTLPFSMS